MELRVGLVLPSDARAQALGRFGLGKAETKHRAGAVGELSGGHLGALVGAIGARRCTVEPFEGHAASILVDVRVFAACAIAIATASSVAYADGTGVVAVSDTDSDRTAVGAAVRAVIAGAPGRPERIVSDAVGEARAALVAGAVPLATLERFRRVREQIDEGWRAFVRVQVDFAASRLSAARTEAESIVALPGGAVLYADASLRLGAVLAHLGRLSESHAALALALALDPDRPITLAEFSPDVVAAVDSVRTQTLPVRSVRIATEPPGAAITVDGKEAGATPLSLDLVYGQHVVVARHAQYETHALAVPVDVASADVTLELRRDSASTRLAEGVSVGLADNGTLELTNAALQFAELDEIVLVASTDRRGGPALLVQRCAGLPARCSAVVDVGYTNKSGLAAAAREAWATVRTADLRYPPSVFADARVTGKKVDGGCKVCRSPILWGSIGAAAVIGTIVVIAVVSGSRPPPVVDVDPGTF